MKIKNYTSSVPAYQSIANIERVLLEVGASSILKNYDANGKVLSICFRLKVDWGGMEIVLPANSAKVLEAFLSSRSKVVTMGQKVRLREQAERTSWRLMEDWVRCQLSLIQLRQAEAAQVFMPYATVAESEGNPVSMFQAYRDDRMKLIGTSKQETL